jgi:anti-sigma-K factor RskA
MSDLVERLRKPNMNTLTAGERVTLVFALFHEAADRIEELEKGEASLLQTIKGWQKAYAELEAEVERLKQIEKSYIARHDKFLQEFWKTNAENTKLREALWKIAKREVPDATAHGQTLVAKEALAAVEEKGE